MTGIRSLWRALAAVFIPALIAGSLAGLVATAPAGAATSGPVALKLSDTLPKPVAAGTAVKLGAYSAAQTLRVSIGLKVPHPAEEEAFLHALQDRNSPQYHHYLTAAQWNARFAPSAAQEQSVVQWAEANGLQVTQTYVNRLVVDTSGSVAAYQKAFAVQENAYRAGASTFFANSGPITVPAAISGAVQSVNGLDNFRVAQSTAEAAAKSSTGRTIAQPSAPAYSAGPVLAAHASAHANAAPHSGPAAPAAGGTHPNGGAVPLYSGLISPQNLWSSDGYDEGALYAQGHCCDPDGTSGQSSLASTIAISTVGDFDGADIAAYAANCCSYVDGTTLAYNWSTWHIDGSPSCCGLETTLDVESAIAESNSFGCYCTTAKVIVYEGANSGLGTLLDVDNFILSQNATRVFSTSWGLNEGQTGASTMNSFHNVFNAMLGQGWTLSAAAGDSGAYDNGSSLSVDYPASDPDVIAAGGSELYLNSNGTFNHETTWNSGGGGCSSYWATPGYQNGLTGCGSRSLPDVSLNASNITAQVLWYDGGTLGSGSSLWSVWGTSEVAPELAGIFAVENSYLLSMGNRCGSAGTGACAPLGDPHGNLYLEAGSTGRAPHYPFYDVTTGNNDNGHGTGLWGAGTGYDLATGWGSFNSLQLARALNWEEVWDFRGPTVTFANPTPSRWYNTDQIVSWTVADLPATDPTVSGVSGFSQGWGSLASDPYHDTVPGDGDSYYSGPQFPNATSGYLALSWAGQGCHTAYVMAWDNVGYSSGARTPGYFCYDTSTPTASVSIDGAAAATRSTTATLAVSAHNPTSGDPISLMRFSTDGVHYGSWLTYSTSATVALPGGDGTKHVYAQVENAAGTVSAAASDAILLDRTAPTVTAAPAPSLRKLQLTPTGVTLNISWAATDGGSGVKSYVLQKQVNGGAWVGVTLPNPTLNSVSVNLLNGNSFAFRVQAVDKAGNTSAFKTGKTFTLKLYEEYTTILKYSAGWTHAALSGAVGGSVDYSTTANNAATFSFTGSQVAWVSTLGPSRGAAAVTLDGGAPTTVGTNGATLTPREVVYTATAAAGAHKLVIKNNATAGHPRIDVDAFVVIQ